MSTSRGLRVPPALLLFGAVVLVFGVSARFEFVNYDDPRVVTANPLIQEVSAANLWEIVSGQLHGDYQPLYLLTYVLDWQLGGGAAWPFHLTNVALHGLSAVLLAGLLTPVLGRWQASAAALLFAVHPLTVEPVAWISSRKDVLMLPLLLGSLLLYREWVGGERSRPWTLVGALALGLAAVLSKTSAVVLPGLVLLDRFCVGERRLDLRREWAPLGAFSLFAAFGVLAKLGAMQVAGAAEVLPPEGALGRFELVLLTQGTFLRHALAPVGLGLGYDPSALSGLERALTIAGLFAAVGGVIWLRRERGALYGAGWWLVALAPVSQLLPFHLWAADRYAYAALPGMCCLLSSLVLSGEARRRRKVVFASLLAGACWISLGQLPMWASSKALWGAHVERAPQHRIAVPNLARVLWSEGERQAARALLEKGWREQPDNYRIGRLYAELLAAAGELEAAEEVLRSQGPSGVKARVLLARGKREAALAVLEAALTERGGDHDLRVLRASLHMEQGAFAPAREDLERALAADPSQPRTWVLLAQACARLDDRAQARLAFARAQALGLDAEASRALLGSDPRLREALE